MRGIVLTMFLALALGGCDDPRGEAIDHVETNAATVSRASGAVNEVIRNSTDCAAAKPLIPEAYALIEEARGKVDAPGTQEVLATLKAQVDRVAQVCP